MISLNKDQDACRYFSKCMKVGEVYDIKIRKECVL
jgi:hypothetical protein